MQDTFSFKAMKETHEQHKADIDIDELITGPTNITIISDLFITKELLKLKKQSQDYQAQSLIRSC
jgi:hypothetical protein